jgi:hypothetical protein
MVERDARHVPAFTMIVRAALELRRNWTLFGSTQVGYDIVSPMPTNDFDLVLMEYLVTCGRQFAWATCTDVYMYVYLCSLSEYTCTSHVRKHVQKKKGEWCAAASLLRTIS